MIADPYVRKYVKIVAATMTEILKFDSVKGTPCLEFVTSKFEQMRPSAQLLTTHDEPFDVAYDILGLPLEDKREVFEAQEQRYDELVFSMSRRGRRRRGEFKL